MSKSNRSPRRAVTHSATTRMRPIGLRVWSGSSIRHSPSGRRVVVTSRMRSPQKSIRLMLHCERAFHTEAGIALLAIADTRMRERHSRYHAKPITRDCRGLFGSPAVRLTWINIRCEVHRTGVWGGPNAGQCPIARRQTSERICASKHRQDDPTDVANRARDRSPAGREPSLYVPFRCRSS